MHYMLSMLQDPWNWFGLDVAVKATLILLLAGGLAAIARRASAAWLHRVWSVAFVGVLALPLLQAATPGLLRPVVRQLQTPAEVSSAANERAAAPDSVPAGLGAEGRPSAASEIEDQTPADQASSSLAAPRFPADLANDPRRNNATGESALAPSATLPASAASTLNWIALVWGAGFLIAVAPLAFGLVRNALLMRSCEAAPDSTRRRIAKLSQRIGLRREPMVLMGADEQMPLVFGLFRPYVLLPARAVQWPHDRFESVLLHELAHIKRGDVPLQLAARLACGIYWFHPLAWWAIGKMRLARELACDDCVVAAGQEPSAYAAELLQIAREQSLRAVYGCAALTMARPSQLEGRLLAVLDATRRRSPVGWALSCALSVLTIGMVVVLGAVRPALYAEASEPSPADSPRGGAAIDSDVCVVSGIVLSPEKEPAAGARIEILAHDNQGGWSRHVPDELTIDRFESRTDSAGRFQIELPRDISRPRKAVNVVASAAGSFPASTGVDTRLSRVEVKLQLHSTRQVRVQLVDPVGNPVRGVAPHIRFIILNDKNYIGAPHPHGTEVTETWPTFSRSDDDGFTAATLPEATTEVQLVVNDERAGSHLVKVNVADDKPVSAVLDTPTFLSGRVVDPDGNPVDGAELIIMEQPFRIVRTDSKGAFRAARGTTVDTLFPGQQTIIHVYPPRDSDLLFQAIEWEWPNEGIGDAELTIPMERGVVIVGRCVESGSGKPVAGARLAFEPQVENNPNYKRSYRSRFSGADMRYTTDAEGHFRLPAPAGPGSLLVSARSLDYLPVETSMGQRWYGEPGLQREYYHGLRRLDLQPNSHPEPISIELMRGETLQRQIIRDDGSPAQGQAFAPSYLQDKNEINGWLPALPVVDGRLDIPGFDAQLSTPLFILDFEAKCGAVVSPEARHVNPVEPTIKLSPCGSAEFRFVNDAGQPLADYTPQLHLILKEGAPSTHFITAGQPLWSDTIIWSNVIRPQRIPKTDADGHVVVEGLIPGADYNVSFVGKDGLWDEDYPFTVRSGETTEVGEVVLPQRN